MASISQSFCSLLPDCAQTSLHFLFKPLLARERVHTGTVLSCRHRPYLNRSLKRAVSSTSSKPQLYRGKMVYEGDLICLASDPCGFPLAIWRATMWSPSLSVTYGLMVFWVSSGAEGYVAPVAWFQSSIPIANFYSFSRPAFSYETTVHCCSRGGNYAPCSRTVFHNLWPMNHMSGTDLVATRTA